MPLEIKALLFGVVLGSVVYYLFGLSGLVWAMSVALLVVFLL